MNRRSLKITKSLIMLVAVLLLGASFQPALAADLVSPPAFNSPAGLPSNIDLSNSGVVFSSVSPSMGMPYIPSAKYDVLVVSDPYLGRILVDSNGMTLYISQNDQPGVSNCLGACADIWTPYLFTGDNAPVGGPGLTGQIGTIPRPDGTVQVTYNGMPLYHYMGDIQIGDTLGQGINVAWSVAVP
jgi:predicted lipoprotein with Yx(FWY)xxD motif